LAPFECLCGNFILPEPASYVFFYAIFNLRNLLYLIGNFCPLPYIFPTLNDTFVPHLNVTANPCKSKKKPWNRYSSRVSHLEHRNTIDAAIFKFISETNL
ncbi:hypothetical protein ACTQ4E_12420, partial [Lawsonibacter sp. LCP25S3_G6]